MENPPDPPAIGTWVRVVPCGGCSDGRVGYVSAWQNPPFAATEDREGRPLRPGREVRVTFQVGGAWSHSWYWPWDLGESAGPPPDWDFDLEPEDRKSKIRAFRYDEDPVGLLECMALRRHLLGTLPGAVATGRKRAESRRRGQTSIFDDMEEPDGQE